MEREKEEIKPLAKWDDNKSEHPNLIWWTRLDKRFQIEIHDDGPYRGRLRIFDHLDQDKLLMDEPTGLAYGAIFGPDVADVEQWKIKALEFVDNMDK